MEAENLILADDIIKSINQDNKEKPFDKNNSLYWDMLNSFILEVQLLRYEKGITQKQLADLMQTKQTAISRFENMGRAPNYDFIVRLANSLGCTPKLYVDGDYAVQVPETLRASVTQISEKNHISVESYLTEIIQNAIITDSQKLSFKSISNSNNENENYDDPDGLAA